MMLRPEAELEGLDADRVLTDVIAAVPVPRQTGSMNHPMNQFTVRPDRVHGSAQPRGRLAWALTPRAL